MAITSSCSPALEPGGVLLGAEALGQRQRLDHRLGLVDGLLEFVFRNRVGHPAAAGLNIRLTVLQKCRANGDAAVKIAVE